MEFPGGKAKKGNLIIKTWERCKSFGGGGNSPLAALTKKSKSLPKLCLHASIDPDDDEKMRNSSSRKRRVAPEGCFSVYVGEEKQRFVIKTEYANHPLFKILLEEAESEYGYNPEGPLVLPCNVDTFRKVVVAMDSDEDEYEQTVHRRSQGCGFSKGYGSYRLLVSPSRMIALNQF
ncbi:auxin-responsive protein SAUR32-like [Mercurialis annua]|uniref:auxin-responsive protein SAUR32-like n=1 Tax=Mercurialis annua TaxID=3986 RepID=UPI00215E5412|nr:auxin-responsive protein SAUR32-like [Mercurialis annua]